VKSDRRLSGFQEQTEASLALALQAVGSGLTDRQLEGVKETFIHAKVLSTDAEVLIYQDAAELRGATLDRRFEVPDYTNADALARAFIEQTVDYAKRDALNGRGDR